MKKILIVLTLILATATVSSAQYTGPSGQATTVSEALKLPDDAYVKLTGKIIQYMGDDMYKFTDGTGEIYIEIDHKHWINFTANDNDTVIIVGEIDKDFTKRTVDVKHISKQ